MKAEVAVRQYDVEGIVLGSWGYNEQISNYLSGISPESGRWIKISNNELVYWCSWDVAQSICDLFIQEGYEASAMFDLLTEYRYGIGNIPLKKLRPMRIYASGWITLAIISICQFDFTHINPRNYRWFRSDEGRWLLAIRVDRLTPWIEYFRKEQFDVTPLVELREEISSGKYDFDPQKAQSNPERAKSSEVAVNATTPEKNKEHKESSYPPDITGIQRELSDLSLINTRRLDLPFEPYKFRIDDAKMMLKMKRIINASDMGLGKTFESVLVGESIPMSKLVVCPASLRLNWKREILTVNPKADVKIVYSDKTPEKGENWTIIGYPSLQKYEHWLLEQEIKAVFFDEAHYVKAVTNSGIPDSKRAKIAMKLSRIAEYCYPITGTPKANRNRDLFNMLRLVNHPLAMAERDFFPFGKRYCNAYRDNFGWHMQGNSNDVELHNLIKDYMVRRLKKDELPGLTKQRILIPVEANLREYEIAYDQYAQIKSYQEDSDDKAAMGALQVARQALAMAKVTQSIDFARSIIDRDEPVVVVTCFRGVVERFQLEFGKNCSAIVGGMSDVQKQKAIDDFQSGKVPIIVMNVIAGGVGITLTKSHTMIINDMDWVIGNVTQAEDRICRTGQNEHCVIYYMIAENAEIDSILRKSLTRKSETLNTAIDGGKGASVKLIEE